MIKEHVCEKHATEKMWRDCFNCDENGMDDHDCGDDSCCCLEPEYNVRCAICRGAGGWFQCFTCAPWEE